MKQKMKMLLTAVLLLLLLTGCAAKTQPSEQGAGPLKITAAVFPAYDWVRNILGENPAGAELTLLTDSGVDLHSYQPSVDDILTISNSDLFIYVGGESDRWVSDALKQTSNPDMHIISMLETLGDAARQEELTEGMQAETKEKETDDTAPEYDEHVWLSLRNAAILCDAVTAELSGPGAVFEENGVKVLARTEGGRTPDMPVIIEKPYGKGKIVVIGAIPKDVDGERLLSRLYSDCARDAGIVAPYSPSRGIVFYERAGEDGEYLFVCDMQGKGGKIILPGLYENVLSGECISGLALIGAYDTILFKKTRVLILNQKPLYPIFSVFKSTFFIY